MFLILWWSNYCGGSAQFLLPTPCVEKTLSRNMFLNAITQSCTILLWTPPVNLIGRKTRTLLSKQITKIFRPFGACGFPCAAVGSWVLFLSPPCALGFFLWQTLNQKIAFNKLWSVDFSHTMADILLLGILPVSAPNPLRKKTLPHSLFYEIPLHHLLLFSIGTLPVNLIGGITLCLLFFLFPSVLALVVFRVLPWAPGSSFCSPLAPWAPYFA